MKPQHEFGKEALEGEIKLQEKKKRTRRTIKITFLLVIIAATIFFWGDIRSAIASNGDGKVKKEKKAKDKTSDADTARQQGAATADITIIKKWELPKTLTEISGLCYIDNERFACVQDELGTIFIYNTSSSSIEKEIPFGAAGDYEGLALVNETAWVLRSDGKLFEVNNINTAKPQVKEYSTKLTAEQDTEGLCYDKENNRLLLAVKDAGPDAENSYKGIYAFDLGTKQMPAEPAYKIDLRHELFTSVSGKKNKAAVIMPSGIAIHPVTKDMYITEGRKAKLLITDSKGVIKKLYQLDNNDFEQPEGITFKPNGEIFISNEGVKQAGNILNVDMAAQE